MTARAHSLLTSDWHIRTFIFPHSANKDMLIGFDKGILCTTNVHNSAKNGRENWK